MENIIYIVVLILMLFGAYMYFNNTEGFILTNGSQRTSSPFYTTTFQAFPGSYMTYDSTRNSYCLQQHPQYEGYRNCMLYLQ
jgi:hypothetical protein